MPSWSSMADFGADLAKLTQDLTTDEQRRITRIMGKQAQEIAGQQATHDLGGDKAFSGWNRGSPIPLATHLKAGRHDETVLLPKFAGGWTVAELGRNQGNAGGFAGPGINRRTGVTSRTKAGKVRKVRAARAKRWNGTTRGKATATHATDEMADKLPQIADREVLKVIRRRFDVTR